MPGKVKVKIVSGRNLPVMDRSSDTTDAYVEIKLGTTTYKTDVCRKSLHPQWNSEWYRFEVDDSELQDEPLQIRLMDHDTYSANDAIGKVYLDLNPLLLPTASAAMKWSEGDNPTNSVMSGWIPVYDTMHGIRGEVNVIVKVELFSDFNKFRQSSCGVPFFCSPTIPHGFYAQVVHGFVEELVVNDDPEYQWIDKIRTPRASNEARQTLFFKLSGELQRKIGVKALDLGGNAVVGYNQSFDLEGESGIVARGIGTAVSLIKIIDVPNAQGTPNGNSIEERTQSYLKFLGSAKGFYLNSTSNQFIRNPVPKPLPSPSLSIRSLRLDDIIFKSDFNSQHMTRHLSDREFNEILRPPTELIHHSTSLQTLLKQEDMRGIPSYGISRKFKNLKYSSQNMLSKKMTALKAKLSDSGGADEGDDKIRNFYKYRRTQSDSTGMAEILVRSVFNATSSLDCIAETPHCTKPEEETLEVSYLSLPDESTETRSSNASSSSSDTSSLEEDDAKDSVELDTISHIVEVVRKLSMPPTNNPIIDVDELMSDEEKLLFVVGDDDSPSEDEMKLITRDTSLIETTVQTDLRENANIVPALKSPGATSESFFPQFAQTFKTMKKTPTALSLSEMNSNSQRLGGTKFTSLHDIHGESSKVNKYSAHEGKMTVLGELFHRVDGNNGHHIEAHNIDSPSHKMYEFFKDGKDKIFHGPKVLFHRLDTKMHHKKEDSPPENNSEIKDSNGLLGTALGNLLMESVNDILVTSHVDKQQPSKCTGFFLGEHFAKSDGSQTPSSPTTPSSPQSPDSFSSNIHSMQSGDESPTTPSTPKSKHDFKNKIFKAPKVLLQHIDSKIHHKKNESSIKNPEGLLNTALSNVLMDSVNEVLVTSHTTDIPQSQQQRTPETSSPEPSKSFFKESKKILKGPKVLFKRLQHKKTTSNDDLVTTALGNVLMDSVKDMLATSSQSDDPKTSAPLENKNANPLTVPPVNTEIDAGNSVSINNLHACLTPSLRDTEAPPVELRVEIAAQKCMEPMAARMPHSPANLNSIPCIHRRSSDSDLSITPKGNSLTGSDRSAGCASGQFMRGAMIRSTIPQENFDILEYPFLTLSKYPTGFITYLGGAVSSRSVKLLERITNIEEPESRDTWWSEIRMEIRSHARALNCNAVLGYTEAATICDEVCVLSASGTAAIIGCQYSGEDNDNLSGLPIIPKVLNNKEMMTTSLDRNDFEKEKPARVETTKSFIESPETEPVIRQACCVCHLPYMGNSVPSRHSPSKCCICRMGKVPDILIATIEMPDAIPSLGRGCFVQSYVCRPMRDSKGEAYAKELSEGLPFLEYELHRLLINKLRVKGMNAVFGLKVRVSIGERMIVGIATGTAVYLTPLPPPPLPKLRSDRTTDEKKLAQLQKSLQETVRKNREIYQLILVEENGKLSDTDDSDDDLPSLDLRMGNKDCCILEVDDPEDVDVLNSLMEPRPPDGFHVVNTELVPGLEDLEIVKNLQMFTQIWRAKISPPYGLDKHFHRLLQSVYFKLRRMIPCALCDLQFRVDSPEPDEIQLCVLGMALGLGEPQKSTKPKRKNLLLTKRTEDDLIFNLEEDQIPEHSVVPAAPNYLQTQQLKYRQKSPIRNRLRQRHVPYKERHGVDITPLSYVPGGKIEKYLGNLNFFFIRETTSLREEGGLSGFIHSFVTEILAIVRAHVTALGGNAMVAYFINECVLNHNLHKNQGQCLVNVGGDVVYVTYDNN